MVVKTCAFRRGKSKQKKKREKREREGKQRSTHFGGGREERRGATLQSPVLPSPTFPPCSLRLLHALLTSSAALPLSSLHSPVSVLSLAFTLPSFPLSFTLLSPRHVDFFLFRSFAAQRSQAASSSSSSHSNSSQRGGRQLLYFNCGSCCRCNPTCRQHSRRQANSRQCEWSVNRYSG